MDLIDFENGWIIYEALIGKFHWNTLYIWVPLEAEFLEVNFGKDINFVMLLDSLGIPIFVSLKFLS